MRIGSILRLNGKFVDGFELYTDYTMDNVGEHRNERITWFEPGELGLVLDTKVIQYLDTTNTFLRILAPGGIGWIPSRFAEEIG